MKLWTPPGSCWGRSVRSWTAIARRIRVPTGFVLVVVYLWLAKPGAHSLILGVVFIIVGLVIRGVASGHLRKNEQLATSGPYAYTRNPLYLGSLVIATGFTIAARSLWIAFILIAVFAVIYLPVIRSEENDLGELFPWEFAKYARRVPRLVPRFRKSSGARAPFSWNLYCKHREYNASIGSAAILAVLMAKMLWGSR